MSVPDERSDEHSDERTEWGEDLSRARVVLYLLGCLGGGYLTGMALLWVGWLGAVTTAVCVTCLTAVALAPYGPYPPSGA